MTTYTQYIFNKEVQSPAEFLAVCLKGLDITNTEKLMDDYTENISKRFDDAIEYHKMLLGGALHELEDVKNCSDEELLEKYCKIHSKQQKECKDLIKKYADEDKLLQGYIDKISAWDCSPEMNGLKEFALRHLNSSRIDMEYVKKKYFSDSKLKKKFQKEKELFKAELLDSINWDINYHKERIEKCNKAKAEKLALYEKFKEDIKKL